LSFLFLNVQKDPEAHRASYVTGTRGSCIWC